MHRYSKGRSIVMGRCYGLLLLMLAVCLTSSCSVISTINPWQRNNAVRGLEIIALPDANQRYSVAVDIVFVFAEHLARPLSQLTAQQWFAEKSGYMSSYPRALAVIHLEPMPGRGRRVDALPPGHADAGMVLVFAHYLNQDQVHRVDISSLEQPQIVLGNRSFSVEISNERSF